MLLVIALCWLAALVGALLAGFPAPVIVLIVVMYVLSIVALRREW